MCSGWLHVALFNKHMTVVQEAEFQAALRRQLRLQQHSKELDILSHVSASDLPALEEYAGFHPRFSFFETTMAALSALVSKLLISKLYDVQAA